MTDIAALIKRAAAEAVESEKPAAVMFGVVERAEPIAINVEQKMTLTEAQLVFMRDVTDHGVSMTVSHSTETGGDPAHSHAYTGKKSFLVHGGLQVGDKVVLLREQGGQRFVVLGRI